MKSKFSHDEVFPEIARLIGELYKEKKDFVVHDEIVSALLRDERTDALIENARKSDESEKTKEWWASNMVQWFSQRITEEKSEYRLQFERKSVDRAWAYKPINEIQ